MPADNSCGEPVPFSSSSIFNTPNPDYTISTTAGGITSIPLGGSFTTTTDNTAAIAINPWPGYSYGSIGSIPISSTPNWVTTTPADQIASGSEEHIKDGHTIQAFLKIEPGRVLVEFKCTSCGTVLSSKVLCKIPKSAKTKKCLPKILNKQY